MRSRRTRLCRLHGQTVGSREGRAIEKAAGHFYFNGHALRHFVKPKRLHDFVGLERKKQVQDPIRRGVWATTRQLRAGHVPILRSLIRRTIDRIHSTADAIGSRQLNRVDIDLSNIKATDGHRQIIP